ncbi:glycosyltransferase 61 family protein [Pseudodesulfovibrio sp. zrk46]|uniref:glycosyltransferase 61 family protein n=1 Tax=Pseudodesulfovibrio sp. zrk46 TaxID=2725288 RepID=UPI001449364F|nr:glycosyltransferase 61 family protein [Pseudodesulfovibrio sp. zrk46]QJB55744.1 DUF563 domain-containing protein [Pseudodesulfovibrio sp. zrk46]
MSEVLYTACKAMPEFPLKYTSVDRDLNTGEHEVLTDFRSLELQKFTNVVASYSPSGVFHKHGPVIPESLLPQYLHTGSIDTAITSRLEPIKGEYIYMGHMISHYGHFFVEALSRLWALEPEFLKGKKLVYLNNPHLTFYNRNNCPFVVDFFDFLGIDDRTDIKFVFEPELFETLYIPTPAISREFTIHPFRKKEMSRVVDTLKDRNPGFEAPKRVYFSRKGLPASTRYIMNEDDVENVYRSFGFSIIQPHALELDEEILSFSDIDVAACLHCSAINNAMFSPKVDKGIIMYDDFVNYREPTMAHIVSSIIDNVYSLKGLIKPAYRFNNNVFWYTPAAFIDTEKLTEQLSFVLNEKPSKVYPVTFAMDEPGRADLHANVASSLGHFGMYDEAGMFLYLAKQRDPERPFVGQVANVLKGEQAAPRVERPLTNRCFTVDTSEHPFLQDDLRTHCEDEEYFNQYAKAEDLLALLTPRCNMQRMAAPAEVKDRLASYGVTVDETVEPGETYDCIMLDGTQGYPAVREALDNALKSLAPKGCIAIQGVLPFDDEYFPKLVSNLRQFTEFQHRPVFDSWKIAYDLNANFGHLDYVTVNVDNGVLLAFPNGNKAESPAIEAADIDAMESRDRDIYGEGFLRMVRGKHFFRHLRHNTVKPGAPLKGLAPVVIPAGEFLSEDNSIKRYYFNKSRAAAAGTSYRLADFIAYSYRQAAKADVAVVGGWEGFAGLYVVNNTVVGSPEAVLPNEENLCVFTLTGQQIVDIVNNAVSQCTPLKNRFYPHASGMDMTRDNEGYVTVHAIGAEQFDPKREYSLVVNSRFANGYPGYQTLADLPHTDTGVTCLDALKNALSRYDYE